MRLFLVLCFLGLAGCASLGGEPFHLADPALHVVWPDPPERARIALLRVIRGPADIQPKYGKMHKLLTLVTGEEPPAEGFAAPAGITVDAGRILYVADPAARVVHRYDLAERSVTDITHAGDAALVSPVGVAVGGDGTLYVTDSVLAQIFIYRRDGKFLGTLHDDGHELQRPAGIAVNSRDEKIVADVLAQKLIVFGADNHFLREITGGTGDAFNRPVSVAVDRNDNIYVTDAMNFTIRVFSKDGTYRRSIGDIGDAPGYFARPKGVAVDSDLHLYVVDATFDNFQIFDQTGKLLLFVGGSGDKPGEFSLPSGIFIDRNDTIYVADSQNRRVQIFQYLKEGKQL